MPVALRTIRSFVQSSLNTDQFHCVLLRKHTPDIAGLLVAVWGTRRCFSLEAMESRKDRCIIASPSFTILLNFSTVVFLH